MFRTLFRSPPRCLMLAIVAGLPRPLAGLWELPVVRRQTAQAADRIYRYLNQTPAVSQAVGAKFLEPLSRTIRFEAVSYSLPNRRKLLDGIDLVLNAGEVIAVVSFDPLKARALACLLPRFIEPQAGRILFDGEDIAWGTLESLRAETVYVGGSDPFFTGTVVENIICSHSGYTLPDVTEAAKTAHAHNFILKLPQGYETVIGEHGEQLDAGQGFRLGLGRAVLRDPALMIIEEPTDSLDEDSKSLLDDSYNRIVKGRTVIFLRIGFRRCGGPKRSSSCIAERSRPTVPIKSSCRTHRCSDTGSTCTSTSFAACSSRPKRAERAVRGTHRPARAVREPGNYLGSR